MLTTCFPCFTTMSLPTPRQLAVLKTPKPDSTGINRAKLRQEARILANMRHLHVVAYVAQTTRPTPGVLFQYCVGGSLRDRIRWHQVHGYVFSSPYSHQRCRSPSDVRICRTPLGLVRGNDLNMILHYRQHRDVGRHNPQGPLPVTCSFASSTYRTWR